MYIHMCVYIFTYMDNVKYIPRARDSFDALMRAMMISLRARATNGPGSDLKKK